jgi:hypothetical protein
MAIMIPARFDETTTSYAEKFLYYHLQDHLDDSWTVIHSFPWLDENRLKLRQGECDFLLLHPKYGLLVLEVKSGAPKYDGPTAKWHYDDGSKITDPYQQAQKGMHFLNGLLNEKSGTWYDAQLPFGYAVAFPDASAVIGNIRPDMGVDNLLLETDIKNIQKKVINLLNRFGSPSLNPQQSIIDDAINILQPTFKLVPSLTPVIEIANKTFIRLTDQQSYALDGLSGNSRLMIRGGAGTGKTLLTIEQAKQFAIDKKVLVLCFNRPLANFINSQLNEYENILATTFHDLCTKIIHDTETPMPDRSQKNFWNELLPNAAIGAIPIYKKRFDAILVDEAQDFSSEWWLIIEELLVDPDKSYFHLFCDNNQNIYRREIEYPFTKPDYVLKRNCRNTKQIAEYAHNAVPDGDFEDISKLPDGPTPEIHYVNNEKGEQEQVRKILHELISNNIDPETIVILGPKKLQNSSLANCLKLGNCKIIEENSTTIDLGLDGSKVSHNIRYSTVQKFKGMEADCVILIGIGIKSSFYKEEHMNRMRYIGGSRAKVILHIIEWG